ncbi:MAG: S8 family peptidase [Candidatus Sericytochromatia bacterium]|nr:S8 family peptidase [Candidatus Sericytochromatia bacterium]
MNRRPITTSLLLGLALFGCNRAVTPLAPAAAGSGLAAQNVTGELLVALKPGLTRAAYGRLQADLGLQTVRRVAPLAIEVVRPRGPVAEALQALQGRPEVRWVEANAKESLPPLRKLDAPQTSPQRAEEGDPLRDKQWGLAKVQAPEAWAVTPGRKDVVLAIIDTGIDYNHPDLAGRVIKGRDFVNNDDDPMDGHAHGTHCAGIAGASANNGIGISGVAPGVTLMAVKVLSDQGSGSTDGVCAGIAWAADQGAKVISLSLGGPGGKQAKQEAVDYARAKGAVVVAAMGNNGGNVAVYPGASTGVISVGATTADDTRASFSNFGTWITVTAPGHTILSTVPGGAYQAYSGTSMATPFVAGLAALLRSAAPDLSEEALRQRITSSAADLGKTGFDPQFGHGRINVLKALSASR